MTWIIVDVEADGPIPSDYSMISFGAICLDKELETTFYGRTRPISELFIHEALAVSDVSRAEHLTFDDPKKVMQEFEEWVQKNSKGKPIFVSDNPAFDWQWVNYYMHHFLGRNCFGFSARRIGDLYAGFKGRASAATEWKRLRKTKHTHNPVDDAKGNAEALLAMNEMGLRIL